MPCGSSSLGIHVMPKSENPISFDWRTITNDSLNNEIIIGKDVIDNTIFRMQAKSQDFNNISCSTPSFSGQICYPEYVPSVPVSHQSEKTTSSSGCDEACGSIIAGVLGSISSIVAAIIGVRYYRRDPSP
ncbi:14243_t:CDS:1 [Funneliformis caledonium]|uniref:14243_t:CDS:1 n=1 Tax=Funneliformis caledonium TaxID=1117310 RepID=A0A9N9HHW9_9GLOM|nr:14243_t:CDS:1 [Funneliformis caledonium]